MIKRSVFVMALVSLLASFTVPTEALYDVIELRQPEHVSAQRNWDKYKLETG